MGWLVLGSKGMLGTDLVETIQRAGKDVVGVDREQCDLRDPQAVVDTLNQVRPDVVVNCAAWTDVDGAETNEDAAYELNATVPRTLARAIRGTGARLVHISTDYVFGGDHDSPIPEGAPMTPESAYGRTKAAGEDAVREELPDHHLILRTAWLYGAAGNCFPRTIVRLVRERGSVSVVDDQRGQPTWTRDLSHLILGLIDADVPPGTYHGTSSGDCSWLEFARSVVAAAGMSPALVSPTDSAAFPRLAKRPAYSVLGHDSLRRAGIDPIGPWDDRWKEAADEVLSAK